MIHRQREIANKLIDEKDKLSIEAKIMHSKLFVLDEIERVNEEFEKTKRK